MDIFEIVQKLNGPIEAVGESHTDNRRYENLKTMIELAGEINQLIWEESRKADRYESSVRKSGRRSEEYFETFIEEYSGATGA